MNERKVAPEKHVGAPFIILELGHSYKCEIKLRFAITSMRYKLVILTAQDRLFSKLMSLRHNQGQNIKVGSTVTSGGSLNFSQRYTALL